MIKVLKIEAQMVEPIRAVIGSEGSRLNPVQDADGNWFISYEELNAPQFAKFFQQDEKLTITDNLVETDYKRPTYKKIEDYAPKTDEPGKTK